MNHYTTKFEPGFLSVFLLFFLCPSNGRDLYDVAQLRPQRPHGRRHLDDFHASPEHCVFSVAVYVHRDRWDYSDVKLTTHDVHLDFHAVLELCGPHSLCVRNIPATDFKTARFDNQERRLFFAVWKSQAARRKRVVISTQPENRLVAQF